MSAADRQGPAVRRLEALPADAPLEQYFEELRDAVREYYLSDPGNPYRESGRSSGTARWEESRRCIADAVHRDGSFLDVGCANGLLLESLERWLAPRSITIEPHGVDFVPELIELARKRLAHAPSSRFHVANVWDWSPPRRYDFVRTNLDYVPDRYWGEWVTRQRDRLVAPGGRLILCWYYSSGDARTPQPSPARVLEEIGWPVAGISSALGASIAWADLR
jgi:SAM-dependent methyltransferase